MDDATIGAICGAAQTIVGHPLDTIKVWVQNRKPIRFGMGGLTNLYAGWRFPMVNSICIGYFLFGGTEYFNDVIGLNNYFASGFLSGVCVTPLIHYTEYFKINEQMQLRKPLITLLPYSHTGFMSSLVRESFSSSVYFGGYHFLKDQTDVNSFWAGGLSGSFSWFFTYPVDVIKTRVKHYPHTLTYYDAYKMGRLWDGLHWCLLRGFIVNGTVFSIYDFLRP